MAERDDKTSPSRRGTRRRRAPFAVLLLLLFASAALRLPLCAQEELKDDPAAKSEKKPDKPYVIALPILYSTPETKLAFGAGGLFNFRLGAKKE